MTQPRIIIVEDEIIIAMDIKRRVISLGYNVIAMAATAEECIAKLPAQKPDLVLMDIFLKGDMDGIEAAQIIKDTYNLPVIYLTAHADEKTIQRAKITQPYGYILKPFELRDLQTTIELALYKHEYEKKLAESEIKYRTLVQTATDGVLILDEDGYITSFNPKLSNMFGYCEEEISRKNIKKLLPSVFINHMREGIKKFLSVGKPITGDVLELYARKNDGSIFPVEISFSQWTGKEDKLFSTLIIRDITRRKEDEEALRRAHDEMEKRVEERTIEIKSLTDQSPFPISVFNAGGLAVYVNSSWEKLWNYKLSQLKEDGYNIKNDPILRHYGCQTDILDLFVKGGSFRTKPTYFDPVDYPVFKDTDGRLLLGNYYALLNDEGRVFQVVNITEDITEKAKAEEINLELKVSKQSSAAMIERLEEERFRISRDLHDSVGQMLSAIKLNIEVYEKSGSIKSKQLNEAKRILNLASSELKNIIHSIHPVIIDNYGLIASLEMLAKEFEQSSNIKLNFSAAGITVRFDPKIELNVFRIIQEALNNIAKHSLADKAEVSLLLRQNILFITVKDNGKGCELESLHSTTTHRQSFGLISMKERTEMLQGNFLIASTANTGTEINIEIPIPEENSLS